MASLRLRLMARLTAWAALVFVAGGLAGAGCAAGAGADQGQGPAPAGVLRQAVCVPGNGGGDLGCGCTDSTTCTGYDDDIRLITCAVPNGMTVGACTDCFPLATNKPRGCACEADTDCDTGSGLKCNGRFCEYPGLRGDGCDQDSDCGTDASGMMTCMPTLFVCGPLPAASNCDFGTDCLSGSCTASFCD